MIDNLIEMLADVDDLEAAQRAIVRERAIRAAMAKTGEGYEVVAEMLDAMASMDQEAVLELTDGKPTTLMDALTRYIRILGQSNPVVSRDDIASDLSAILEYPWPADEERLASHGLNTSLRMEIRHPDDERMEVWIGGRFLLSASHEEHGWAGMQALENAAQAVHRAVLVRVIGDRDHAVQINAAEASSLVAWAVNSSGGSWSPGITSRLSVDAVSGGGWLVRTRPYAWQYEVNEERRRQREAQQEI